MLQHTLLVAIFRDDSSLIVTLDFFRN